MCRSRSQSSNFLKSFPLPDLPPFPPHKKLPLPSPHLLNLSPMGCVSSSFLEDDAGNITPTFGHHIVSLTSTTYGLLSTLDPATPHQTPPPSPPPPPPPPPRSISPAPPRRPEPEIINSWELMAGLDPLTPLKPLKPTTPLNPGKENAHRSLHFPDPTKKTNVLRPSNTTIQPRCRSLESFERLCPPGGEQAVVLYTTTLGGIRKTFEDCNAVRAALESLGVWILERDVSMDLGFREELRGLMAGKVDLPKVFVRGRYIGGAEQVLRIHEEGGLGVLVEGLPKVRHGGACDGCGGVRFLPCFRCSGSRKLVLPAGG
ncbi:uncharacterized protein At5g39865-like, partial [Phalaenopsis equestris]|uniref:uncharacterized protein At5g39865-like n=1 Tax=Phalaenopsis equestris TaxID=78828 RepID=UPI0009E440CD